MLISGNAEGVDAQRKAGNPFSNTLIELKTAEIGRNICHLRPIYFFAVFYSSLQTSTEEICYLKQNKFFALKLNLAAL